MEAGCDGKKQSNVSTEIQRTKKLIEELNHEIVDLGEQLQPVTLEKPSCKKQEDTTTDRPRSPIDKLIWENNECLEGQISLIRELRNSLEI